MKCGWCGSEKLRYVGWTFGCEQWECEQCGVINNVDPEPTKCPKCNNKLKITGSCSGTGDHVLKYCPNCGWTRSEFY